MSTRMSFFWNLAAEQRLGGRKWNLFLDRETLRKMTADRCITIGGRWCCSEDLDWTGGWRSSAACHLSPSQKTAERGPEVLRPSFCALPRLLSCVFVKTRMLSIKAFIARGGWGGVCHRPHVGSHGKGRSAHCSRKVRRFSHIIFLLYRGQAVTWHDPQLIWIPKTPKTALYSFFVFYVPFLLWGEDGGVQLSGGALSHLLACWGDKKKKPYRADSSLLTYPTLRSKSGISHSQSVYIHSLLFG